MNKYLVEHGLSDPATQGTLMEVFTKLCGSFPYRLPQAIIQIAFEVKKEELSRFLVDAIIKLFHAKVLSRMRQMSCISVDDNILRLFCRSEGVDLKYVDLLEWLSLVSRPFQTSEEANRLIHSNIDDSGRTYIIPVSSIRGSGIHLEMVTCGIDRGCPLSVSEYQEQVTFNVLFLDNRELLRD